MNKEALAKQRLRRLVAIAAIALTVIGLTAAVLMLTGKKTGIWPLLAGDLILTLTVLGLAWRALR